jgi:hypothetical protein
VPRETRLPVHPGHGGVLDNFARRDNNPNNQSHAQLSAKNSEPPSPVANKSIALRIPDKTPPRTPRSEINDRENDGNVREYIRNIADENDRLHLQNQKALKNQVNNMHLSHALLGFEVLRLVNLVKQYENSIKTLKNDIDAMEKAANDRAKDLEDAHRKIAELEKQLKGKGKGQANMDKENQLLRDELIKLRNTIPNLTLPPPIIPLTRHFGTQTITMTPLPRHAQTQTPQLELPQAPPAPPQIHYIQPPKPLAPPTTFHQTQTSPLSSAHSHPADSTGTLGRQLAEKNFEIEKLRNELASLARTPMKLIEEIQGAFFDRQPNKADFEDELRVVKDAAERLKDGDKGQNEYTDTLRLGRDMEHTIRRLLVKAAANANIELLKPPERDTSPPQNVPVIEMPATPAKREYVGPPLSEDEKIVLINGVPTKVKVVRRYVESHTSTTTFLPPTQMVERLSYPGPSFAPLAMPRMSQASTPIISHPLETPSKPQPTNTMPSNPRNTPFIQAPTFNYPSINSTKPPQQPQPEPQPATPPPPVELSPNPSLQELTDKNLELEAKIKSLMQELLLRDKWRPDVIKMSKVYEELTMTIDALKEDIFKLKSQLSEANSNLGRSQQINKSLMDEIEGLRRNSKDQLKELENAKRKEADAANLANRLQNEKDEVVRDRDNLEAEVIRKEEIGAQIQKELDQTKAELMSLSKATEAKIRSLMSKIEETETTGSSTDRKYRDSEVRIKELERKLKDEEARGWEKERRIHELSGLLHQSEDKERSLDKALRSSQDICKTFETQLKDIQLKLKISDEKNRLRDLRANEKEVDKTILSDIKVIEAEQDIKKLRIRIQSLENELERAQQDLLLAGHKNAILEEHNASLSQVGFRQTLKLLNTPPKATRSMRPEYAESPTSDFKLPNSDVKKCRDEYSQTYFEEPSQPKKILKHNMMQTVHYKEDQISQTDYRRGSLRSRDVQTDEVKMRSKELQTNPIEETQKPQKYSSRRNEGTEEDGPVSFGGTAPLQPPRKVEPKKVSKSVTAGVTSRNQITQTLPDTQAQTRDSYSPPAIKTSNQSTQTMAFSSGNEPKKPRMENEMTQTPPLQTEPKRELTQKAITVDRGMQTMHVSFEQPVQPRQPQPETVPKDSSSLEKMIEDQRLKILNLEKNENDLIRELINTQALLKAKELSSSNPPGVMDSVGPSLSSDHKKPQITITKPTNNVNLTVLRNLLKRIRGLNLELDDARAKNDELALNMKTCIATLRNLFKGQVEVCPKGTLKSLLKKSTQPSTIDKSDVLRETAITDKRRDDRVRPSTPEIRSPRDGYDDRTPASRSGSPDSRPTEPRREKLPQPPSRLQQARDNRDNYIVDRTADRTYSDKENRRSQNVISFNTTTRGGSPSGKNVHVIDAFIDKFGNNVFACCSLCKGQLMRTGGKYGQHDAFEHMRSLEEENDRLRKDNDALRGKGYNCSG